jgi:CheY-like chemotaxis protein
MPGGGNLTLAVDNVHLTAEEAAQMAEGRVGDFVCITVQDTGSGIPADKLEKIFQPFFTTKAPGKGTGLGLSSCQSIVKNHHGFMTVYSEVNEGTEFKVYLPVGTTETERPGGERPPQLPAGHGERILIIDDEEGILALARTTLENYGYRVSTAASGIEAIARFREDPEAILLVMIDQTMPFMDGQAIAAALGKIRSDVKIIMTGDADAREGENGKGVKTDSFIAKPFTTEKLLTIIHQALA